MVSKSEAMGKYIGRLLKKAVQQGRSE